MDHCSSLSRLGDVLTFRVTGGRPLGLQPAPHTACYYWLPPPPPPHTHTHTRMYEHTWKQYWPPLLATAQCPVLPAAPPPIHTNTHLEEEASARVLSKVRASRCCLLPGASRYSLLSRLPLLLLLLLVCWLEGGLRHLLPLLRAQHLGGGGAGRQKTL